MNKKESVIRTENFVSKLLSNKCKLASIVVTLFILSVTTAYAAPRYNFVKISDGDYEVSGYSDEATVKDLIDEHGLEISKYDVVYPSPGTELASGMTVTIDRPRRVNLTCAGYTVTYWTVADDFGEFIKMHDIVINENDISSITPEEKLDFENFITITRVENKSEEISSEIPYETEYVNDDTLEKGKTVVKTQGQPGIKITEYTVVTHDGVEVSREISSEREDKAPVNEVIARGTKSLPDPVMAVNGGASASAHIGSGTITVNGQAYSYSNVLTCSATAYDLSFESTGKRPGDPYYGITASGTYAKRGTVAVDPRVIPLGTKMYIVSTDGSYVYGLCTAEDTGGAIKGNKVDLFYDTNAECMRFGRRNVMVYILR